VGLGVGGWRLGYRGAVSIGKFSFSSSRQHLSRVDTCRRSLC
jgi:hypothetical protein